MELPWWLGQQVKNLPRQGRRSPGMCSSWELEFRDCGAIPRRELLLTVERWFKGMWGRRLWCEMPVEESQAAMEARRFSECWALSQLFPSPLSLSSRGFLVPLHFLYIYTMEYYSAIKKNTFESVLGISCIAWICRWYHPYGRKWRRTKEPLDESERGEGKSWLKAQHSEN